MLLLEGSEGRARAREARRVSWMPGADGAERGEGAFVGRFFGGTTWRDWWWLVVCGVDGLCSYHDCVCIR